MCIITRLSQGDYDIIPKKNLVPSILVVNNLFCLVAFGTVVDPLDWFQSGMEAENWLVSLQADPIPSLDASLDLQVMTG